jgi:cytoskeletal protein CcmA (bactofilin family)
MWKRDEAPRPPVRDNPTPAPAPAQASSPLATPGQHPEEPKRQNERDIVNIGKSVVIKGELNGSEDLTIEGHVEGKIELRDHVLTIGPNGKIKASVFAKSVVVLGEVTGDISATDKVDIRENGSVDGDIAAPKVAIAEGAHFRGSIDMQRGGVKPVAAAVRPAAGEASAAPKAPQPAGNQPAQGTRPGA